MEPSICWELGIQGICTTEDFQKVINRNRPSAECDKRSLRGSLELENIETNPESWKKKKKYWDSGVMPPTTILEEEDQNQL